MDKVQESDWLALESNAEAINNYIEKIGFETSLFNFQDLLSVDEWAQEMIQKPVLGLLFVFPGSKAQKEAKEAEKLRIEKEGQTCHKDIYFMKQLAMNACGTVGIYHILGNLENDHKNFIMKNSNLSNFLEATKDMNPQERGEALKNQKELKKAHKEAVSNGTTNVKYQSRRQKEKCITILFLS